MSRFAELVNKGADTPEPAFVVPRQMPGAYPGAYTHQNSQVGVTRHRPTMTKIGRVKSPDAKIRNFHRSVLGSLTNHGTIAH